MPGPPRAGEAEAATAPEPATEAAALAATILDVVALLTPAPAHVSVLRSAMEMQPPA
jgi:hypothetical protein